MATVARTMVREIDHGWNALKKTLKTLKENKSYVKVGVLGDSSKGGEKRDEDGLTNAELAAIQEFGTRNGRIPPRPFVGGTFEKNRDTYIAKLRELIVGVYDQKMDVERALGIMGAMMASDIKKAVMSGPGIPPPNARSTVLAKSKKNKPGKKLSFFQGKGGRWHDGETGQFVARERAQEIERGGVVGNVRTLIDTARMIGSVTWAVILRGDKDEA